MTINKTSILGERFGPYSFWHHEHRFRETSNGVEMQDIVFYTFPEGKKGFRGYL